MQTNKVQKFQAGKALVEFGVGMIPIAGEIADIWGIARGLMTGNYTDAALSAAALIIPGATGPTLKAGTKLVDVFGEKAMKLIQQNSDDILRADKIIRKKHKTMNEAVDALKIRKKSGLLETNRSEIADLSNIDTSSKGFLDKLTKGSHGYDVDEMFQKRHIMLDPDDENGAIIHLLRNTDPQNQEQIGKIIQEYDLAANQQRAKRLFAGAKTYELNYQKGNSTNLPRIKGGESVVPEHVYLGSTQHAPKQGVMIAGHHGNKSHTYDPNNHSSQSGLNFLADSAEGAIGYSQMNPGVLKRIIQDLPEGKAKQSLADAFEFTELFDSIYLPTKAQSGIPHHLSNNIPKNAFLDPQFKDYVKARELLTKIYPQTHGMGGLRPVLIPDINPQTALVVNGRGASHLDMRHLSPEDYIVNGQTWMPGQRFGSLTAFNGSNSVGEFKALDPTFKQHRNKKTGKNSAHFSHLPNIESLVLTNLGNNTLGNQIGVLENLFFKNGGKLNYFNYVQ